MNGADDNDLLIRRNRIVHLDLAVRDAETGELLEHTVDDGAHFVYLHGHNTLVPALEAALQGLQAGSPFHVRVADACGPYAPDARRRFSRADANLPTDCAVGDTVTAPGPHGSIELVVVALTDHDVELDANHPLAGRTLEYTGRVLRVLRAHKDEIRHHRPHPAGHHLMVHDSSFIDKLDDNP
ncbi:MAG: hypothetical protein AAF460_03040 [Pseudomonadota bacterium]